jgi:hypothetical protein
LPNLSLQRIKKTYKVLKKKEAVDPPLFQKDSDLRPPREEKPSSLFMVFESKRKWFNLRTLESLIDVCV